jgi:HSP20 family protein
MRTKTKAPATTDEARIMLRDPFEPLAHLQAQMDRLFTDRFPLRRVTEVLGTTAPRTDIFEQNGSIVVKAELPGVKKEDIDVSVESGDLVIRGEHTAEEAVEEKDYYRMERSAGSYYRRLPLPDGVTAQEVTATHEDGVLTVTVRKPQSAAPAQTKVPVS